jgi:quercetin dioxygenase-like cupin family protein
VTIEGRDVSLEPGEAVWVPGQAEHTHSGGEYVWEVLLAAEPPQQLEDVRTVFSSDPLEGVPAPPLEARMMRIELVPGGMTTVHTHPGPEHIFVTEGRIEYESAPTGTIAISAGQDRALPADTPVQKRNPFGEMAAFLAWFLVDPDRPFAPTTAFDVAP